MKSVKVVTEAGVKFEPTLSECLVVPGVPIRPGEITTVSLMETWARTGRYRRSKKLTARTTIRHLRRGGVDERASIVWHECLRNVANLASNIRYETRLVKRILRYFLVWFSKSE